MGRPFQRFDNSVWFLVASSSVYSPLGVEYSCFNVYRHNSSQIRVLQQSGLNGIRDNSVSQGQTNVKQTDRWGHVYTVNTDQGLVNLQENVSLLNSLTNGQCAFSWRNNSLWRSISSTELRPLGSVIYWMVCRYRSVRKQTLLNWEWCGHWSQVKFSLKP